MEMIDPLWKQAEACRDARLWSEADRLYTLLAEKDASTISLMKCGEYWAERQQYHLAIVQLTRALDIAQAEQNLDHQAALFGHFAAVYRDLGDHSLAQRFQRQVLSIHHDANANDLIDWSSDAICAGKITLAEKLIQNALDLSEDAVDISQQADAWGQWGIVAARQADPRKAVRFLVRAARGHHMIGDDRGLGVDFQNLAEIFGLMDRYTWQRLAFQAAETCFERSGMPQSTQRVQHRIQECERLNVYRHLDVSRN